MSKSVNLDDRVQREPDELRLKKETFSDVVARVNNFYQTPGQGG